MTSPFKETGCAITLLGHESPGRASLGIVAVLLDPANIVVPPCPLA
jgi:hypothetical protein